MQAERRLSQRLINYWHKIKGKKNIPLEHDFLPEDVEDLWSNCFLIKQGVSGNPLGFRYSYVGKEITEKCINSPSHIRHFLEHMLRLHEAAAIQAEKAIEQSTPVEEEGSYTDEETNQTIFYRRCFLPFKDKSTGGSTVIGGFRWKIEPAETEKLN